MIFRGIVAVDIVAIGFYGFVLKINLRTPMVTGRKPSNIVPKSQAIEESRLLVALIILIGLVCALAAIIAKAPNVPLSIF